MGCKSVVLDLRFDTAMNIIADKDIPSTAQNIVKFKDLPNLSGGHTLSIGDQIYTIGNGLSIVGSELVWIFTRAPFAANSKLTGYLQSDSLIAGEFYRLNLILHFK
jgi:hypothetical protein